MYFFNNDYSETAAPEILERLMAEGLKPQMGYGLDEHSQRAADLIRKYLDVGAMGAANSADAADAAKPAVHFLAGGTQVNMVLIAAALKPYEAVISASSGHINVHETGAIEGQGHKILTAEAPDGKLSPEAIRRIVGEHIDEHMVKPRLVYISQTTEVGTVYRLSELEALRSCCDELNLYLYLDGARLGSALAVEGADVSLADLARLTDAFTIGGTKNGLLYGEALVLINPSWHEDFRYQIKHRGAMLAKGFVVGLQFERLFEDDLFFRLARHANQQATKLAEAMKAVGLSFSVEPESNQLFPLLSAAQIDHLRDKFVFSVQDVFSKTKHPCRFVTSWATTDAAVDALIQAFNSMPVEAGISDGL